MESRGGRIVTSSRPPDARRERSTKPLYSRSPSLSPTHPSRAICAGQSDCRVTLQPAGLKSRMNRPPLGSANPGSFGRPRQGIPEMWRFSDPGSCREPPGRDTESAPTGGSLLLRYEGRRKLALPKRSLPQSEEIGAWRERRRHEGAATRAPCQHRGRLPGWHSCPRAVCLSRSQAARRGRATPTPSRPLSSVARAAVS